MDKEALDYAFELFTKDGYTGSKEDFTELIQSNDEALNYSYDLFKKDGYKDSIDDYKSLVLPMAEPETPPIEKGVTAEEDGELASPSAGTSSSLESSSDQPPQTKPLALLQEKERRDMYKFLSNSTPEERASYGYEQLPETYEEFATMNPTYDEKLNMAETPEQKLAVMEEEKKRTSEVKSEVYQALFKNKEQELGARLYEKMGGGKGLTPEEEKEIAGEMARIQRGDFTFGEILQGTALSMLEGNVLKYPFLPAPDMSFLPTEEERVEEALDRKKIDFFKKLDDEDREILNDYIKFAPEGSRGTSEGLSLDNQRLVSESEFLEDRLLKFTDNPVYKRYMDLYARDKVMAEDFVSGLDEETKIELLNNHTKVQEILALHQANLEEYNKNQEDLKELSIEEDIANRRFGIGNTMAMSYVDSVYRIFGGMFDAVMDPMLELTKPENMTYGEWREEILDRMENDQLIPQVRAAALYRKHMEEMRGLSAKEGLGRRINSNPFSLERIGLLAAEQLPVITTLAAGGGAGLTGLGASVYGEKIQEYAEDGDVTYKDRLAASLTAGSEVISERVTQGILSKSGRVWNAARREGKLSDIFSKSFATGVGLNSLEEGSSEVLAQLGENFSDIYIVGGSDKNMLTGVKESFIDGAMMGGIMRAAPEVVGSTLGQFLGSAQDLNRIRSTEKEIASLLKEASNPDISTEALEVIENRVNELRTKNQERIDQYLSDIEKLDTKDVKRLANIGSEIESLRAKMNKIVKDESISEETKERFRETFQGQIEALSQEKENVIQGAKTRAQNIEEYKEALSDNRAERRNLSKRYNSGEITLEEFEAGKKELNKKLTEVQNRTGLKPEDVKVSRRNTKWDESTKEALPESEFESAQQVEESLTTGTWGIVTAENPNTNRVSDVENKEANEKAEQWLKEKGYKPIKVFGKYGNSENSFFVPNITKADAIEFAKKFNQESVAHSEGLVYQDGSMNPIQNVEVNVEKDDYYSTIKTKEGNVDFAADYDFSQRVEPLNKVAGSLITAAKMVRSLKTNTSAKDAMSKLQSSPLPLFEAAWNTSIEIAASTLEATGNLTQAIDEGLAKLRESDWYKDLKFKNKRLAENVFRTTIIDSAQNVEEVSTGFSIRKLFANGFPVLSYLDDVWYNNVVKQFDQITEKYTRKALDHNNKIIRNIGEIATSWFNGLPRTVDELARKRKLVGQQEVAYVQAAKLTEELQAIINFDPDAAERVHQVMDPEMYDNPITEEELNESEKELMNRLMDINNRTHETNYQNGFISEETYEEYKGKYIGRAYLEFEELDKTQDERGEYIDSKIFGKIYKERKAITEWMMDNKVTDPIYLTVNRMIRTERNVAVKHYGDYLVATNQAITEPKAGYEQLNGKQYGSLDGLYLPKYLAEDFKGYSFSTTFLDRVYDMAKSYDRLKVRQFYKKLHTVFSPVVQLGNFFSNHAFAFVTGVNIVQLYNEMADARSDMKKKEGDYLTLLENGIIGSNVLTPDLVSLAKTPQDELKLEQEGEGKFRKIVIENLKKFDTWATKTYAGADDIMKLSAYKALRKSGYSESEAIQKVFDGFQNYATVGKVWDLASKTPVIGNAYIKFQADLMRIMSNAVRKRPLSTAAFLSSLELITWLASYLSDEPEEVRKTREGRGYIPKINLGFTDIPLVMKIWSYEVNLSRFISPYYEYSIPDKGWLEAVGRFMPYQFQMTNKAEKGQVGVSPETPDVLLGAFVQSFFANRDFRNKSISDPRATRYQESGLTTWEKIINKVDYTSRSMIPLYALGQDALYSSMYGEDFYGRSKSLTEIIASRFVKIQTYGKEELVKTLEGEYNAIFYKAKEINDKMSSVDRRLRKDAEELNERVREGKLSESQAIRKFEGLKADAEKRYEKYLGDLVKEQEKMNKFVEKVDKIRIGDNLPGM